MGKRPKGRRCPRRHRHLWVLSITGGVVAVRWLWCSDCGAITDGDPLPEGVKRRWAYPGDGEAAHRARRTWE